MGFNALYGEILSRAGTAEGPGRWRPAGALAITPGGLPEQMIERPAHERLLLLPRLHLLHAEPQE
nr:hypothetical protein GCM10010200_030720 [Actinomadura rugatobispora]